MKVFESRSGNLEGRTMEESTQQNVPETSVIEEETGFPVTDSLDRVGERLLRLCLLNQVLPAQIVIQHVLLFLLQLQKKLRIDMAFFTGFLLVGGFIQFFGYGQQFQC